MVEAVVTGMQDNAFIARMNLSVFRGRYAE
jgi:hypothetical protein